MPIRRSGGVVKVVSGADPAAGAEVSDAVPAGKEWRVYGVLLTLVTSATVATRRPHLVLDDGTTVAVRRTANATQAASLTQLYSFAGEGPDHAVTAMVASESMPSLALGAGFRIRTITENLQAGDNYAAPAYLVEEFDA